MDRDAGRVSPPSRTRRSAGDDEPDARPHERVPAEQDRDRCRRGRLGQCPQPRIRDALGEQQVRREPIFRHRPVRFVGPEPVCQQHSRVHDRGFAEPAQVRAKRLGPVALEQSAEDRSRWSLAGDARPQAAFLDQRTSPGGRRPLEPRQRRRRGPTGDEQLGARIAGCPTDGNDRRLHATEVNIAAGVRAEQHQVEWTIDVDRQAPPPAEIADLVAGNLLEPARQRIVGRQVGDLRQARPRPGDCDDIRRVAVVGEGEALLGTGDGHEVTQVARSGERDRAGSENDEPGRAIGTNERAEPGTERGGIGRSADDGDVRGPGRGEPLAVPSSERTTLGGHPSLERAGIRGRLRVHDSDRDGGHGRSLVAVDEEPVTDRRVRTYIGLGANVGHAEATLTAAVAALAGLPDTHLRGVSRLYATDPVGDTNQPEFRNAVVALDVSAGPDPATGALGLMTRLKDLERSFGRRRRRRWGPRELDLDLLVFGRARIRVERPADARSVDADAEPAKATKLLEVPHPAAVARLFVLAPLADLAPRLVPPSWTTTVETARRRQAAIEGADAVRAIAEWSRTRSRWEPVQPR